MIDLGCESCGREDPLLETADGRALCIKCIELDPHHCGIELDAIETLKLLTRLAAQRDPQAN